MNVPYNPYKISNRDNVDNQKDYFAAENETPDFPELFQVPTDVKEAIDLTDGVSIKSRVG